MLSPSNSAGSSIEELSPTIRNPVDTGHPLNYPVRHSHLTLESQKEKANQIYQLTKLKNYLLIERKII